MSLPQLTADRPFLSDGGLETTLVFQHGVDLPDFAAFPLLDSEEGRAALISYYTPYLDLAERLERGFVLDTPTWRASLDWGRASATTQPPWQASTARRSSSWRHWPPSGRGSRWSSTGRSARGRRLRGRRDDVGG